MQCHHFMCTNFVCIKRAVSTRHVWRCVSKHLPISGYSQTAVCIFCPAGGFTSATDKQRINAFLRCGLCSGLCPTDVSTFEELCVSQPTNSCLRQFLTMRTRTASTPSTNIKHHKKLAD